MADNITLNAGSGGAIIATDDVGGVQYQLVKVTFGVDGTATDVSSSSPLPVAISGALATGANVIGGVTQSGTWNVAVSNASLAITAAALPLPAGAATSAKQDTLITAVQAATPAGENHIGAVGGNSAVVGGSFNRPADTTAYAIGDLVANSTTAGSVTPIACAAARVSAGTGVIRRVRLTTTKTGTTGAEVFRVHLFKTSPTAANGDNGAFSANGRVAVGLGYIDVTMSALYSDGAKGFTAADIVFDAAAGSQNIYALIEARSTYAPATGETFTLALEVLQD
jgi:hypothetical protein